MTQSQYKNKSVFFIESARVLTQKEYPVAIPHCAYYGCYQLMMHIWMNVMGKTDADLKTLVDAAKAGRFDKGSHNVLIKEIVKFIKSDGTDRKRTEDSIKLNNDLHSLKLIRHRADYNDSIIDMQSCRQSLELAEETIPLLEKYMK